MAAAAAQRVEQVKALAEGPDRVEQDDGLEPARRPDAAPDPGRRRHRADPGPDPLRERRDLRRAAERPGEPGQGGVPPGPGDDQGRRDLEVRRAAPRDRPEQAGDGRRGGHSLLDLPPAGRRRPAAQTPSSRRRSRTSPSSTTPTPRCRPTAARRTSPSSTSAAFRCSAPSSRRSPDPDERARPTRSRSSTAWPPPIRRVSTRKASTLLDAIVKDGGKIASYAAFRKISAEFAARNDEPGANLMANQKKWMTDLKAFLDKYPKADEAPDALLQLASANEFNAEEDEARKYYEQLARDFPATDARQEGRRGAQAARPGRQADRPSRARASRRGDRHGPVQGQDAARHLLGDLGRPGPTRPARAGQDLPEVPRQRTSRSSA